MAMTSFAPAITRSRKIVAQKSAQAALRLVPDVAPGEKVDHKYFVTFVSVVAAAGLLLLLTINTLLAQDAFELHRLNQQVTTLSDQKEALMRQIASVSSPQKLASTAKSLGMIEPQTPTFLDLTPPSLAPVGFQG